jgi:uncharacterized membrane protein YfcA
MVIRVVHDGKRKVMISAATRLCLFLCLLQMAREKNPTDFHKQNSSELFFERAGEERDRLLPRVLRVFRAIAFFVVGIFEGVTSVGID